MRKVHLGILTGTAIATILMAAATADASPFTRNSFDAAVPLPDSANVPPPTANDVGLSSRSKPSAQFAPAEPSIRSRAVVPPSATAPSNRREQVSQSQMPGAGANASATPPGSDALKVGPTSTAVAGSDAPVADKLRELITSRQIDRLVPRKNERDAIVAL